MFWNNDSSYNDNFNEKAKPLTDNKVILHQQKVKDLIKTLSVKERKEAHD